MYDSGKIITGLIIALIILTFPIWWNLGSAAPPAPKPVLAEEAKKAGKCIRPADQMKTSHMQILDDWRNKVVRDGQRWYLDEPADPNRSPSLKVVEGAKDFVNNTVVEFPGATPLRYLVSGEEDFVHTGGGKLVEMSLQNTCMECHTSKKQFCDQCHNYAAVSPFCWDCHVEPEEKE